MDKIIESQNNDGNYNCDYDGDSYVLSYYHGDRDHDEYIYDSDGESMNMSFIIKRFNKQLVRVNSTLNQNNHNSNSAAIPKTYFYWEYLFSYNAN